MSLVSLRKKDLSEETLDALGVDISYLHRGKFDPATLTALLKIIDRKQIDILHLHGYGATTFGRLAGRCGAADDPARAREPHRHALVPEGRRPPAGAVHRHRDCGVARARRSSCVDARLVRPEKVKVVYLGAPLEEFGRAAIGRGDRRRACGARHCAGRLRDRHGHAAARVEGQHAISSRPPRLVRQAAAERAILPGGGRAAAPALEAQARALGLGDRFVFVGFATDVRASLSAFDLSVFPSLWEGTPLTVFEALAMGKPIVATDADGLLDVLADGRDARDRAEAQCRGARRRRLSR